MREPLQVFQILLLFEEKNSRDYGVALWAALHEVEAFYNLGGEQRIAVRRLYISPHIPGHGVLDTLRSVGKLFGAADTRNALDRLSQDESVQPTISAKDIAKRDTKTYDQEKLVEIMRSSILSERLTQSDVTETRLMIMIDKPITPPSDWRYIIWDVLPEQQPRDAVISIAPLDPAHWGESESNRVGTIKDRARTAALTICGAFLGLHRCLNPHCFLYADADSVNALDGMVELGFEHSDELKELTGRGFAAPVGDPTTVDEVVQNPRKSMGGGPP
jgi:hypothetical protein